MRTIIAGLGTLFILLPANPAEAGFGPLGADPAGWGRPGFVVEQASRMATFTVFLTDCNGNRIGNTPFTRRRGIRVTIGVPGTFGGVAVGDVKNITNVDSTSPGATADLDIKSLYVDSSSGQVLQDGVFNRLGESLGRRIMVEVPDLYADTNGSNDLGVGDLLYSLVDVYQYIQAIPSFSLGDHYQIVNGEVPSLPGMLFSSTPFITNPNSPTGYDYTPITIEGVVDSLHGLEEVPEPCSLLLVCLGVACIVRSHGHRERSKLH